VASGAHVRQYRPAQRYYRWLGLKGAVCACFDRSAGGASGSTARRSGTTAGSGWSSQRLLFGGTYLRGFLPQRFPNLLELVFLSPPLLQAQNYKISQSLHPNSLIFGGLKEKT